MCIPEGLVARRVNDEHSRDLNVVLVKLEGGNINTHTHTHTHIQCKWTIHLFSHTHIDGLKCLTHNGSRFRVCVQLMIKIKDKTQKDLDSITYFRDSITTQ